MKATFLNHSEPLMTAMILEKDKSKMLDYIDKAINNGADALGLQFCYLDKECHNEKDIKEVLDLHEHTIDAFVHCFSDFLRRQKVSQRSAVREGKNRTFGAPTVCSANTTPLPSGNTLPFGKRAPNGVAVCPPQRGVSDRCGADRRLNLLLRITSAKV